MRANISLPAKKTCIFLMGPTAVGKTALAMALYQQLPVDIISVDSAMVYRGLDIGSSKPTALELQHAPHQLINICDPSEVYSVAQFCQQATAAMESSWAAKRMPLLVGGTMLYFKALQFGLTNLPTADPLLRQQLFAQAQQCGWPAMHQQLQQYDATAAAKIHPHDSQRIQRALEVYLMTGEALSTCWHKCELAEPLQSWRVFSYALMPTLLQRAELHQRITQRFAIMLQQGLLDEVSALYQRNDLTPDLPALRSVGYRQVWHYLAKKLGYDEMCAKAVAATRQLAKRQITWLRRWPQVSYINPFEQNVLSALSHDLVRRI